MTDPQPTEQPAPPLPTPCRFVLYTLTDDDARAINGRRDNANKSMPTIVHVGNTHRAGDELPMLVVTVWPEQNCFNGQVFLDGNDTLWKTSVKLGDGPGTAMWPPRVS